MSQASRKGATFERQIADHLRFKLGDTRIDRRVKHGTNDRGDIAGLRTILGSDFVLEAKNHQRQELSVWLTEAELEAGNADAPYGAVVHKHHRRAVGEQYVTMTLDAFAWLLEGGPKAEQ